MNERFGIYTKHIALASRLVKEAVTADVIIPCVSEAAPKMMKYIRGGQLSSQEVLDGYLIFWLFPKENSQSSPGKFFNLQIFNDVAAYLIDWGERDGWMYKNQFMGKGLAQLRIGFLWKLLEICKGVSI